MGSVDVIVPCYRYAHFLPECVSSVLAQEGPTVRVLVIDDASPDNTKEIANQLAARDSRVTVLSHSCNRGHIATYNEGIEWASAKYLLLLSADDYLLPGALDRAVKLMERHDEVGLCFGNAINLDEQGERSTTKDVACESSEKIFASEEFILFSAARNIVPTPTAIVRTELQKRVGGYLPELPHAGDMEMWLRLAAHASVGFIATPQAVYRRHASNMSISYSAQRWLPDLEQRRSALYRFFQEWGTIVPNSDRLYRIALSSLAREACIRRSRERHLGEN
jgi:GT2 family glycosyltransferase